jgi:hypothetical protein
VQNKTSRQARSDDGSAPVIVFLVQLPRLRRWQTNGRRRRS